LSWENLSGRPSYRLDLIWHSAHSPGCFLARFFCAGTERCLVRETVYIRRPTRNNSRVRSGGVGTAEQVRWLSYLAAATRARQTESRKGGRVRGSSCRMSSAGVNAPGYSPRASAQQQCNINELALEPATQSS